MASGNTLDRIFAGMNDPGATTASLDTRNGHPCLDFNDTANEVAVWSLIMPAHYSNVTGITIVSWWAATSAVSGDFDVDVALERVTGLDIDADSFATAQSIDGTVVSATSGIAVTVSNTLTAGSQMDSVVAGDLYRIKFTRDAVSDTATGDMEFLGAEIRET